MAREVILMPRGRPPTCPHCGKSTSVSKGVRKTKTMGIRRLRRCKACGRKFTPRNQKPIQPSGKDGDHLGFAAETLA